MGNARSLKRSIARNPLNVWRAKQKEKLVQDAIEASKPKPFELTPDQIKKINEVLKENENKSKQEETQTSETN